MGTYGMPYIGSKNSICKKIIDALPKAEYFVDLFGGGGAMSHCAIESGKYNKVIYNEINPLVYNGFVKAINGGYKDEKRWISREDFFKLKDKDFYVACCFSFGNNLINYAYSRDIEPYKKALHYSRVFNDNSLFYQFGVKIEPTRRNIKNNEEKIIKGYKNWLLQVQGGILYNNLSLENLQGLSNLEHLQRMQNLERLQRLQRLQRLEIECFNLSYEQVLIPENSVIYCDIPYKNKSTYSKQKFDYKKFYDWCKNSPYTVYISEYDMPDDFTVITEITRVGHFSPTNNNHKVIEKLYCNKCEIES